MQRARTSSCVPGCHPQVRQSHPPRTARSPHSYLFNFFFPPLMRVPAAKARALLTLSSLHFASSPPLDSIQNYSATVPITLFFLPSSYFSHRQISLHCVSHPFTHPPLPPSHSLSLSLSSLLLQLPGSVPHSSDARQGPEERKKPKKKKKERNKKKREREKAAADDPSVDMIHRIQLLVYRTEIRS